jgi:soluble lytic murein transglycosylase
MPALTGGGDLPPNREQIRLLLSQGLFAEAVKEVQYAQKVWGETPALQATLGFIYNRQGDLRRGINAMKRAYPQYLSAGGEQLPPALLRVLFPVNYWTLIRKHAAETHIDPFLLAALIAQESTFAPDAKSSANAIGLMQLLPSTGRQYARALKLKFTTSMLTQPETNIRMGTRFLADLVGRYGGVHFALASYNAGEHRVARWKSERPGLETDEFIDDIPFPETQNYVKKIIGTAEDYRRLYAASNGQDDAPDPVLRPAPAPTPTAKGRASAAKRPASQTSPAKKKTVHKPAPRKGRKPAPASH